MEQRHYCPCDKKCDTGQYYCNWCYGDLCEDAKKINVTKELEIFNKINRMEEDNREHIKLLEYALKYFENGKTYDNSVAYTIASTLIKNELHSKKE